MKAIEVLEAALLDQGFEVLVDAVTEAVAFEAPGVEATYSVPATVDGERIVVVVLTDGQEFEVRVRARQ